MNELLENIEKQLLEIEILKNIYCNQNEFVMDNEEAYCDANEFVQQRESVLLKNLGFSIKFNLILDEECNEQLSIEVVCRLPLDYPLQSPPELLVRLAKHNLSRKFYENLNKYIRETHTNDSSILTTLEWIKDNLPSYLDTFKSLGKNEMHTQNEYDAARAWIYFHHIFSLDKRQHILSLAKTHQLTGFSHPGKPGMTCVEGYRHDVDEFVKQLKKLPWKKMQIKEVEQAKVADLKEFCKFNSFDELLFQAENQSNHVDLGILFNFLKEKKCSHILSLFFGINGE